MTHLFKKAASFTDIHFGKRSNDRLHNEDCLGFIKWFKEQAIENKVDCVIFSGDFFDNRNSVHLSTLNYGLEGMEILNSIGVPVYFLVGNHDSFYKEKRELSSVSIARNLPNIKLINEITFKDGVLFCPWLVKDEWKRVEKLADKSSYVFGHFELPRYMMNAQVEMPDHEGLQAENFKNVEFLTFSGHFHKRQFKDKVCYMGNAFPHDFSDTWDDDRGMMLLEWGKTPEFKAYPKAPTYKTLELSELLESKEELITDLTYAKISNDLGLSYEEVQLIKDIYTSHYNPRRFDISSHNKQEEDTEFEEDTKFHSVDQIVIDGLMNIDSVSIDKNMLVEIFKGLSE